MNQQKLSIKLAGKEDFKIIKNLVPFYIYDISYEMDWDCNEDGRWDGLEDLLEYWEKDLHHPYLIKLDEKIVGFALLRPYPYEYDRNEIGEFFIAKKFTRKGIGTQVTKYLFDTYRGKWLIRVLKDNNSALSFWNKIIGEYTNGQFIITEEEYFDPNSGNWEMVFYRFTN
jgi:predicted acetyltransferase